METMFVARATYHIEEDLKRNWSAPLGGFSNGDLEGKYDTPQQAADAYNAFFDTNKYSEKNFAYHPAYHNVVEIHYHGLGAWEIEGAESFEEAEELLKTEYRRYYENPGDMAITDGEGDGHFYAQDVVDYKKVEDGLYIIQVKLRTCYYQIPK
jgi:hypothetical protein